MADTRHTEQGDTLDAGLLQAFLVRRPAARRGSRSSFFQLARQRRGTIPRMQLIAHEDVLVFARGTAS